MKIQNNRNNSIFQYAALYGFNTIVDPEKRKKSLLRFCQDNKVLGTFLIANEGINGTVSGQPDSIENVVNFIKNWNEIKDLEIKYSNSSQNGFYRMKVKVKKEIVTMGIPFIDPNNNKGKYIEPKEWNDLISKDDVIVIDTRNFYETSIGKFTNSIIPETKTFRDFPKWADNFAKDKINKTKKIAMYCTGGIRCEKATSYMKEKGFDEVYHLKGGILKYLETVSKTESHWEGDCFVFDQRVSVKQDLEKGDYKQCYACKMPLSKKDYQDKNYIEGVSCLYCYDKLTNEQKIRFSQRQKQITLSKSRGEGHLGHESPSFKKINSK